MQVTDHRVAALFFIEGLGLTRDPYWMVGVRNMWVNVVNRATRGPAVPSPGNLGSGVVVFRQQPR